MEKVLALEKNLLQVKEENSLLFGNGQDDEPHHSNRISIDTSLINVKPQLTAEEMVALFKPAQPTHIQMQLGYNEQEIMTEN